MTSLDLSGERKRFLDQDERVEITHGKKVNWPYWRIADRLSFS